MVHGHAVSAQTATVDVPCFFVKTRHQTGMGQGSVMQLMSLSMGCTHSINVFFVVVVF